MTRPLRQWQRGFTLIEVVLAMVLLAGGMVLAFAVVRSTTAIGQRGEQVAAQNERMRAVQGLLRRQLENALAMSWQAAGEGEASVPPRFVGTPAHLMFVAPLPSYLGRGGPYLHDLGEREGDVGTRQLVLRLALVQAGQVIEESPPRPPEVLVSAIQQLRLRYRGVDPATGELLPWSERWDQPGQLPVLVALAITVEGQEPWPELVVRLPQPLHGGGGR